MDWGPEVQSYFQVDIATCLYIFSAANKQDMISCCQVSELATFHPIQDAQPKHSPFDKFSVKGLGL